MNFPGARPEPPNCLFGTGRCKMLPGASFQGSRRIHYCLNAAHSPRAFSPQFRQLCNNCARKMSGDEFSQLETPEDAPLAPSGEELAVQRRPLIGRTLELKKISAANVLFQIQAAGARLVTLSNAVCVEQAARCEPSTRARHSNPWPRQSRAPAGPAASAECRAGSPRDPAKGDSTCTKRVWAKTSDRHSMPP